MSFLKPARALALGLLGACSAPQTREEPQAPAQAHTHFTERSELFVEFPALVRDRESPFAVHVTRLADFKPLTGGRVSVVLSGGGGPEESFEAAQPTTPGIFRPVVRPGLARERRLHVVIRDGDAEDRHDLGMVRVFEGLAAAEAASKPAAEHATSISFLKEQQWRTEFATAPLRTRRLRASVSATGVLRARSDGEARVTAPVAGRLGVATLAPPEPGRRVRRNEALTALYPLGQRDTDLASLEQTVSRARLALDVARRERERLEKLLVEEAVPERRVISARGDERAAEADMTAARRRLEQHLGTQRAEAGPLDRITVRAPIDGTVVEVRAAPGVVVEPGQELLRIVDLERLWLEVRIPEADIARVRQATAASFRVQGFDQDFEVGGETGGRVLGLGGVLDPHSRTVPLLFEVPNPDGDLRVEMSARVRVYTGEAVEVLAIPVTAVVDDGGKEVSYLQVGGEAFERRVLRLGIRDGGFAEVIEGLAPDDRVVTKGAYEVRLAASSTSVPAHGHAH